MTKDPRSPNHDPTSAPTGESGKEGVVSGDIPNEILPETRTVTFHLRLERNATLLLVASLLVVSVGGIVEIAPLF